MIGGQGEETRPMESVAALPLALPPLPTTTYATMPPTVDEAIGGSDNALSVATWATDNPYVSEGTTAGTIHQHTDPLQRSLREGNPMRGTEPH